MSQTHSNTSSVAPDKRARVFVDARLSGQVVSTYPGDKPQSLEEAYQIQNDAISLFPDKIAGWKVGRITGEFEQQLGCDRLAGPVFEKTCFKNSGAEFEMPVFGDAFAAIEGEVTAIIGSDAPEGKLSYSTSEALDMIASMHLGVEIASSPFPEINEHGPLVTISDFGNNYGLILGREIQDWRDQKLDDWVFETVINGHSVGRTAPTALPGGPVESVRFLLENTARRGLPLKKGMMVLTGAVTGVHQAYVGDVSRVTLGNDKIALNLVDVV